MLGATREGVRRALGAPRMLALLWMVNFLLALPAAWALAAQIHASVEHSLVHERLRDGFDMGWHEEFQHGVSGLATTFGPDVAGGGAVYRNLEAWITGKFVDLPPAVLGAAGLYLLAWVLLQGGVVDHVARPPSPFEAWWFVGVGARFFFRFLRLALIAGVAFFLVLRGSVWLYGQVGEWTRDVAAERPVLWGGLAVLGVTAVALAAVQTALACAKIATVVEDRRSMLLAAAHGARCVLRRPLATLGTCLGFWAAAAALVALYARLAPIAGPSSAAGVALAFAGGQVFLAGRLALRVALLGALAALHGAPPPTRVAE